MSKGLFYAGLMSLLWAVLIITPVWLPDFSAADIVFGRFLVCGLTAIAILIFRRDTLLKITVESFRRNIVLSSLGCVFFYLMLVASVRTIGVFPAMILFGALPVISQPGLGWNGKPALCRALGLLLITCTFLLVYEGCRGECHWVSGLLYLTLSLLLYQFYVFFQRQFIRLPSVLDRNDHLLVSGLAVIPCLLLMLVLQWVDDPLFGLFQSNHEPGRWRTFWLLSVLGGGFCSLIARAMWLSAIRGADPLRLSRYSIFLPTCASVFVFAALGRLPVSREWLALGCLVLALYTFYRVTVVSKVLRA